MAVKSLTIANPIDSKRRKIESSNGTADNDIFGGAATVHRVRVDCTLNTTEDVYVRLYNHASPTVGTTAAKMVVKGYKGKTKEYWSKEGFAFATAVSVATVKNAGGTSGSDNPTGTVKLWISGV